MYFIALEHLTFGSGLDQVVLRKQRIQNVVGSSFWSNGDTFRCKLVKMKHVRSMFNKVMFDVDASKAGQ